MRVVHSKHPLPRDWSGFAKKAILTTDIQVSRSSRLLAKLLVFRNGRDLRKFWKKLRHGALGVCHGAVNALQVEVTTFQKGKPDRRWMEVDPVYFCVIGLLVKQLSMEIICHESAHAGFFYHNRLKRNLWPDSEDFEDENVCYPTGRIASAINRALDEAGLYPWSKK